MLAPTFLRNSEIIRFNATPFFPGDGVTSSAPLLDRHGNPISAGKLKRVDSIYRTDWQGRQLLYATARTNLCLQSQGLSSSPWAAYQAIVSSGGASFAGAVPYLKVAASVNGITLLSQQLGSISSGAAITVTVAFRASSSGTVGAVGLYGSSSVWGAGDGSTASVAILSGPGNVAAASGIGMWRVAGLSTTQDTLVQLTRTYATAENAVVYVCGSGYSTVAAGVGVLITRLMVTAGVTPQGGYIPTTTTAIPVTDYTLTGPSVAFGQVPVAGSMSDWTGVAKR